jgi:hypothetical protein
MVVVYKIWWASVGTLSHFVTLLQHNAAKRLPNPDMLYLCIPQQLVIINSIAIMCNLFTMSVAWMRTGTKYWVRQVETLLS